MRGSAVTTGHNPWLDIPAADYVGHMGSPEVGQLAVLSELFREALERFRPADLLWLGCSTGNGIEHIDPTITRRVRGIDVNPEYLACLVKVCPQPAFELTLTCDDVLTTELAPDSFDLVHCALLFEYVDWRELLPKVAPSIRRDGGLSVVLQRPSDDLPAVTKTRFDSLRLLETRFAFVDPAAMIARASECGLDVDAQRTVRIASGKAFEVIHLGKNH